LNHNIAVIDTLTFRALTLCDKTSVKSELNHIRNVLLKNNYPEDLIRRSYYKMQERIRRISQNLDLSSDSSGKERLIIPYIGNITDRFCNKIKKFNLKFGYIPGKCIKQHFRQHIDKRYDNSGVVYIATCNTCNRPYPGETQRPLEIRIKEHVRDISKGNQDSALACHVMDSGLTHIIDSSSFKVVEREDNWYKRKFKESLHIHAVGSSALNKDGGMEINSIWLNCLPKFLKS
jgi:hypothetical protein